MPHPLGGMYTHYLIFFRFGDLSPPPIYLFHHLFRSVWICEYLLYTLGCIQYYVTLWLKLVQFWPSGAVSVAPMSFCGIPPIIVSGECDNHYATETSPPHHCGVFFFFKRVLTISGTISCSRLISYSPCHILGISHFSKEPWFLFIREGN